MNKLNKNEKQKQYSWLTMLILIFFVMDFIFYLNFPIEEENSAIYDEIQYLTFPEEKVNNEILIYVDELPFDVDKKYKNSVREAISYWEAKDNVIFKETFDENKAQVRVQWVKEFGGEHLGYALGYDFIEIGLGDSLCSGKWKPYTYDSVLHITKHELGHVLGYEHDDNPESIMYQEVYVKYEIAINETEVIPSYFYRAYPLCTKTNVTNYLLKIKSDTPINVYVVPSQKDYELLTKNKEFYHYSDCQAEEVRRYEKTCEVTIGSILVLENLNLETAQFELVAKEI